MEKNLRITCGILNIVSGALFLLNILILDNLLQIINMDVDVLSYLLAGAIIVQGVTLITNKIINGKELKKNDIKVYAIVDCLLCIVQFLFDWYQGFGVFPLILLIVSSIIMFVSLKRKKEEQKENSVIDETKSNDTK